MTAIQEGHRERETQRERPRDRDTERETERDRERPRQTERDREKERKKRKKKEINRERKRSRERKYVEREETDVIDASGRTKPARFRCWPLSCSLVLQTHRIQYRGGLHEFSRVLGNSIEGQ